MNTNSSDTHACQTCYNTQYAPYYLEVTCAWSVIKSLSENCLNLQRVKLLNQHQFLAPSQSYLTKISAFSVRFNLFAGKKQLEVLVSKFARLRHTLLNSDNFRVVSSCISELRIAEEPRVLANAVKFVNKLLDKDLRSGLLKKDISCYTLQFI